MVRHGTDRQTDRQIMAINALCMHALYEGGA